MGCSLGVPVLSIGIKRLTQPKHRVLAYSLFYFIMNLAAVTAAPAVDSFRERFKNGLRLELMDEYAPDVSAFRLLILSGACTTFVSLFVALTVLRDSEVLEDGTVLEVPDYQQATRVRELLFVVGTNWLRRQKGVVSHRRRARRVKLSQKRRNKSVDFVYVSSRSAQRVRKRPSFYLPQTRSSARWSSPSPPDDRGSCLYRLQSWRPWSVGVPAQHHARTTQRRAPPHTLPRDRRRARCQSPPKTLRLTRRYRTRAEVVLMRAPLIGQDAGRRGSQHLREKFRHQRRGNPPFRSIAK